MRTDDLLDKKVWAVVGVSADKTKFGYRVYNRLKNEGYQVYPVNPNLDEIDGDKVYPDLAALPECPDVVNFVVPPAVTAKVIPQCAMKGVKYAWLQPGSDSKEVLKTCKENNVEALQSCVLRELSLRG
jgi:uncharacterized protein